MQDSLDELRYNSPSLLSPGSSSSYISSPLSVGSLPSSCSLPSQISDDLLMSPTYFNEMDFSGSIPISHKKASIFGESIPVYRRFNILNSRQGVRKINEDVGSPVKAKSKEKEVNREGNNSFEKDADQKSMLGKGFKYDKEAGKVFVRPEKRGARRPALVQCKKISKHSTSLRNLRPKQNDEIKPKKKKEFTKIPGPLPRVHQRNKLKREMSSVVEAQKEVAAKEGKPTSLKKKIPGLKRAIKDVIAAMRMDNSICYWDKYFGPQARVDFFEKYKEAGRNQLLYLDNDWPENYLESPRSMYMKTIVNENLTPLTILLRKEEEAKGLFLGHKGLGDAKLMPVIQVLENLPTVETIDFSDNRLTDESLMPLALKLTKLQNLTSLNLSDNKIDDSSQVIMDYLRNKDCKLKSLYLDAADVDDNECCNLAQAILENESIEILSLRNNLIGKDELLNVVNPDLETGGEALGEMLCHNQTITELDVSWNFIRLDSACQLADSLLLNNTLVTLKLAYNAFGDLPTQYLGKALKENTTLEYLDVQYNSITPRSATVLANALIHNDYLETVVLDGNILGDVGSQAVVAAIQRSSNSNRNLNISFANCDCKLVSSDVFNAANPAGLYTLELSEPYGQMVCEEIIYLGNYRAGCVLNSVEYKAVGSSTFKKVNLHRPISKSALMQKKCISNQRKFATLMLELVERRKKLLKLLQSQDGSTVRRRSIKESSIADNEDSKTKTRKNPNAKTMRRVKTIEEVSDDGPTELDLAEEKMSKDMKKAADLCKVILEQYDLFPDDSVYISIVNVLLKELERNMANCSRLEDFKEDFTFSALYHVFFAIFELNDTDHSGDMDIEEFLNCILCLGVEFERKYGEKLLRDFDLDQSGFIDNQEFAMIMVNEFCRLDTARDELVDEMAKQAWVIPSSGTVVMDVSYQCELPSIFDVSHDEGIMAVIKGIRDVPTEEQREIIFQNATTSPYFFMSAQQALMLFEEMGKNEESRLDVLARVLPQLVSPEQCHRFIDSVLNAEGKFALRVKMGQSYNVFMGLYSGHYTFDLKHSQKRQEGRALAAVWAEEMMYMRKHKCDTSQRGNYSNFRNETLSGIPMAVTSSWFAGCPTSGKLRLDYVSTMRPKYGNWPLSSKRFKSLISVLSLESIMELYQSEEYVGKAKSRRSKRDMFRTPSRSLSRAESTPLSEVSEVQDSRPSSETTEAFLVDNQIQEYGSVGEEDSALTLAVIKEYYVEYMETCHHYHSIYPPERQRDVSRADYDPNARPVTPDVLRDTDVKPSLTKYHKIFPHAYMKLLKLQLALPILFLSIDQVIEIMRMFPPVDYLRVQAFVSMFSRIVDFDKNGVRALDILNRDEQSELFHRVGILNVIDPMWPDRIYRLDLRRWDHRECCKIMIELAMAEPGENWLGEDYRWSKYDGNVPGWSLPMQWTASDESHKGEGGPRRHGWCSFTYTTTEPGCAPNWSIRREVRKKVLCGIKRSA